MSLRPNDVNFNRKVPRNCPICGKPYEWYSDKLTKLHYLKCILNKSLPFIRAYVPETERKTKLTPIITKIFAETTKDLKRCPERFYKDGHFPQFLDTLERAIIYVVENDGHYRVLLLYALLAVMDIMQTEYQRFNAKAYYFANREAFKGLSLKDPRAKPLLFLHAFGEHGFNIHEA